MKGSIFAGVFLSLLIASTTAFSAPAVGRKEAAKYFGEDSRNNAASTTAGRVLMLHLGAFTSSESFYWTRSGRIDDVAKTNFGLTYRMDEFTSSMDLNIRADFTFYHFPGEDLEPFKMSILPLVTFPDAGSGFPLYFGLGGGLGVFFRQIKNESNLTFDYQLVAGARFMNIADGAGFFIESGLKNHLHLLSDGQINGVFFSGGAIFTF